MAIIGAGPAGCTCALALRHAGLRVVLVDRAEFPRDKVCGDAIPGPAFRVMDAIHPKFGEEMRAFAAAARVRASRGFAPTGASLRQDWTTFSYNCERYSFDAFLLDLVRRESDTRLLLGRRLRTIGGSATGYVCHLDDETSFSTALLIGCDGANSVVARELAGHDPRGGGSAVRAYHTGIAGLEPGVNEFHFLPDLPLGYFWIFPLGAGRANVGLGVLSDRRRGRAEVVNPRRELERVLAEDPRLAPRFAASRREGKVRGFALPFYAGRRPLSGHRFLLCGDAASLVSPLWGHGIDTAMRSGLLAARRAGDAFAADDFTAARLAAYDREVYAGVGRRFRRHRRLLGLVSRFPGLLRLGWAGLRHERAVRWLVGRLG